MEVTRTYILQLFWSSETETSDGVFRVAAWYFWAAAPSWLTCSVHKTKYDVLKKSLYGSVPQGNLFRNQQIVDSKNLEGKMAPKDRNPKPGIFDFRNPQSHKKHSIFFSKKMHPRTWDHNNYLGQYIQDFISSLQLNPYSLSRFHFHSFSSNLR